MTSITKIPFVLIEPINYCLVHGFEILSQCTAYLHISSALGQFMLKIKIKRERLIIDYLRNNGGEKPDYKQYSFN